MAIYGDVYKYTHAARQLSNGLWTSKIGQLDDIEYKTPDDLTGSDYGRVIKVMRRRVQGPATPTAVRKTD